jgi:hypothetical protein
MRSLSEGNPSSPPTYDKLKEKKKKRGGGHFNFFHIIDIATTRIIILR